MLARQFDREFEGPLNSSPLSYDPTTGLISHVTDEGAFSKNRKHLNMRTQATVPATNTATGTVADEPEGDISGMHDAGQTLSTTSTGSRTSQASASEQHPLKVLATALAVIQLLDWLF